MRSSDLRLRDDPGDDSKVILERNKSKESMAVLLMTCYRVCYSSRVPKVVNKIGKHEARSLKTQSQQMQTIWLLRRASGDRS